MWVKRLLFAVMFSCLIVICGAPPASAEESGTTPVIIEMDTTIEVGIAPTMDVAIQLIGTGPPVMQTTEERIIIEFQKVGTSIISWIQKVDLALVFVGQNIIIEYDAMFFGINIVVRPDREMLAITKLHARTAVALMIVDTVLLHRPVELAVEVGIAPSRQLAVIIGAAPPTLAYIHGSTQANKLAMYLGMKQVGDNRAERPRMALIKGPSPNSASLILEI